jgi:hypothetical protein
VEVTWTGNTCSLLIVNEAPTTRASTPVAIPNANTTPSTPRSRLTDSSSSTTWLCSAAIRSTTRVHHPSPSDTEQLHDYWSKMRDPRLSKISPPNCSAMNTRASYRRRVMVTKPNFERFRDHEPPYYWPSGSHGLAQMSRNRNIGRPARQRPSTPVTMTIQAVSRRVLSDLSRSVVTLSLNLSCSARNRRGSSDRREHRSSDKSFETNSKAALPRREHLSASSTPHVLNETVDNSTGQCTHNAY